MVEQRSALLLALLLIVSHAYTLVAYASRAIVIDAPPCADVTERFDAVGLECRPCPQGKVVSASGDQCECPAGTVLALADSSTPSQRVETCLSCDEWFTRFPALGNTTTLTPAYDGLQCISCGITASLAGFTNPTLSGGSCACPTGFATVEVGRAEIPVSEILALGSPSSPVPINAKMCVQCPADTVVDPLQPHVCSRCEYPKVRSASNACVCPAPLPTVRSSHRAREMARARASSPAVPITTTTTHTIVLPAPVCRKQRRRRRRAQSAILTIMRAAVIVIPVRYTHTCARARVRFAPTTPRR